MIDTCRKYPRTLHEAFPGRGDYAECIERYKSNTFGFRGALVVPFALFCFFRSCAMQIKEMIGRHHGHPQEDGLGPGNGSGSGSGYGKGLGSGSGWGSASGSGSGYGSGWGSGAGFGDGFGFGFGDGHGQGQGHGDGSGRGSGAGSGYGSGDCG